MSSTKSESIKRNKTAVKSPNRNNSHTSAATSELEVDPITGETVAEQNKNVIKKEKEPVYIQLEYQ